MYFISTLRVLGNIVDDCRTVGYTREYGCAHSKIMDNVCDIFEDGYYQYAVITKIKAGIYSDVNEEQWFQYDRNDKSVLTIAKPDELQDYRPYIIG